MQTGQSIRACLRRGVPADHEAHSRSGRQLRRVATTELRRDCSPEAEAGESQTVATNHDRPTRRCSEQTRAEQRHGMTSGTRPGGEEGPPWTIAGNRAEQGLTRGAVRRLRYRPSRHRLHQRGVPSDAQEWPQTRHGGVHDQPEVNALHTRST